MLKGLAKKPYLWLVIVFSLIVIATTAVSTMAWFTLVSPPASELVTGSADVTITSKTGYKVIEKRSTTGRIDYDNQIVTRKEIGEEDFTTTDNENLEEEDLNFDVPTDGIGYYIVTPNTKETYKFSETDHNYAKFTGYNNGDMMSTTIDLYASEPFRIRSYQMQDHKTDLQTATISSVNNLGTKNNNEVTVASDGNYKVWIDPTKDNEGHVSTKVGLERLGNVISPRARITNPKNTVLSSSGGGTVYLLPNSDWKLSSAKFGLYVFSESYSPKIEGAVQLTQYSGDYYSATIPAAPSGKTWAKMIFVRTNSSWNGSVSTIWNSGIKWNQTDDLEFPSVDGLNCYKITGWDNSGKWISYNNTRIKVGNNSPQLMNWDETKEEWNYTISGAVATGTSLTFSHDNVNVSVTREADGESINNVDVSNGQASIGCGGDNLTVYLHKNHSVWVDSVNKYQVKPGSGSYTDMTYNSTSHEWSVGLSNMANSTSLTFRYGGGRVDSVTKKSDGSEWYNKNNFNGSSVIRGGTSSISIFLNDSKQVWVETVIEARSGTRSWTRLSYNETSGEYYATGMTFGAGETLQFQVNGSSYTGWSASTADYNNVTSGKKIEKACDGDGAIYINRSAQTVWVEGNKKYEYTLGGVTQATEMTYQSGGDFDGWYKVNNVAVTATTLGITLNGTAQEGITAYNGSGSYASTYNNYSAGSILKAGTVSIYYNTSDKKIFVTPVYSIKIGSTQITVNASNEATFTSNVAGDTSVKVYRNTTEATNFTAEGSRTVDMTTVHNNCGGTAGALKTIYDATGPFTASINTTNSTVWLDGYSVCYFYKIGSGSWTLMTDNGDDSQVYADITAGDDVTISFKKNAAGSALSVTAKGPARLNNYQDGKIVNAISSKRVYLDYAHDNQVWIPGRVLTYHFYDQANTVYAYMWQNGNDSIRNAAYPGVAMTADPLHAHVFDYVYTVGNNVMDRLIFNLGNGAKKSIDLSIADSDDYLNKYAYFSSVNDAEHNIYNIECYSHLPSTDEDIKMYVYDKNTVYFGDTLHAFAWDGNGAYMPVAAYPGVAMTEIIPGSLWSYSAADEYSKIKFCNGIIGNGERQTAEITFASYNDRIFVATGVNGSTVNGTWTTTKTINPGTAKIYVDNVEKKTMSVGDCSGSGNYFIYERGVQAAHGQTLKVVVTDGGGSGQAVNRTYDNNTNFVVDDVARPYLTINSSYLKVNLGSDAAGQTARFNFYITTENKIAIVMVPDLGNGFYIMPHKQTTDPTQGFIGATKMNSTTNSSAIYSGFYAAKNSRFFIRSYLDAVDKGYTLADSVSSSLATSYGGNASIIEFQKSAYFNIEVNNGKIYITEFTVEDFLHLNRLDMSQTTNQAGIKAQHTAIVLEVEFKSASSNAFAMTPQISVQNDASDYVGVAVAFTNAASKPEQPWAYMTNDSRYTYNANTNPNGLTQRGSSFTLGNESFTLAEKDTTSLYYAYILIDYVYTNSISSIPHNLSANLQFYLRTVQA